MATLRMVGVKSLNVVGDSTHVLAKVTNQIGCPMRMPNSFILGDCWCLESVRWRAPFFVCDGSMRYRVVQSEDVFQQPLLESKFGKEL